MKNRKIMLAKRPTGRLAVTDFELVVEPVPTPADGEVLCRTLLLSLDPANRAWMRGRTYRDQLGPGELMAGFTLSRVVDGNGTGLSEGTVVVGEAGWQDYAAVPADQVRAVEPIGPLTHEMSVYGVTGLTAYFGLLSVGRPRNGETVLVSAAAGATGNVVGQLARQNGCRVIGVAGTPEKCRFLVEELGFDAAVNHRSPELGADLDAACPDGVDIYFDNVGGDLFSHALRRMRRHGRIVVCGAVAGYDGDDLTSHVRLPTGIAVVNRLRIEGFLVTDFINEWHEARTRLAGHVASGSLEVVEDVIDGLENAPDALVGLLAGANVGKRLVRVAHESE